jgi:putative transposase
MKKRSQKQGRVKSSATDELPLSLKAWMGQELRAFVLQCGMAALQQMLEDARSEVCGARYARGRDEAWPKRAGSSPSRVVLGGRKVKVHKPRVRLGSRELELPVWAELTATDPLSERMMEQMVLGVSTRKYDRSLEPVQDVLEASSTSKSTVSRQFQSLTQMQLDTWMKRPMPGDILAVMVDGIHVGEHVVVMALGLDARGDKHILGLWEGSTENTVVCMHLLSDLVERGLDPKAAYLFIIDGSKALRKAILEVFGPRALVQRCQVHKVRNVLGHLPEQHHSSVRRAMHDAYCSRSASAAHKRLRTLAKQLEQTHPSASRSLLEGLDDTLTVKHLQLSTLLERSLASTNMIENLNGRIRQVLGRVKRWRSGQMVLRWVVAGAQEAQRGFRRVRGYQDLPKLKAALGRHQHSVAYENQAA